MTQRKSVSKSQTCLGSFRLIEFPHSLVSGSFVAFRLATTAFSLWIFLAEHHSILCTLLNLLQMDAPFFSTLWVLHGAKRGLLKQHQQFGKTNKQTKNSITTALDSYIPLWQQWFYSKHRAIKGSAGSAEILITCVQQEPQLKAKLLQIIYSGTDNENCITYFTFQDETKKETSIILVRT